VLSQLTPSRRSENTWLGWEARLATLMAVTTLRTAVAWKPFFSSTIAAPVNCGE
jgi:hypothetical protein